MSNERTAAVLLAPALGELTALAQRALGRMTPEQSLRAELTIEQSFSRVPARRSAWRVPALAAGLAAIALSSAWALHHAASPTALSYVIENGGAAEDHSLDVEGGPPRTVRFSDGTEVRVDQGTRARIRFVTNQGAELAMTHGALHAAVVHSATSEWRFDAGPFVVHVTGTAFGLSWDPELDRFDLRLEHGSVTVSSPVVNEPIPVRAGQWLTIRPRSNEVFIRDLAARANNDEPERVSKDEPAPEREPAPELRPAQSQATRTAPASSAPASAADSASQSKPALDSGHDWEHDLPRGKADQIVDDALRRGLDGCLEASSSRELAALADAARYTRRNDVARRVLLAERRRFAGSRVGVEAALLLGRLAEAEQNDGQAVTWFDTYLAEAPAGAHASEALGRKMAIVRHIAGVAGARAVAQEYLAKYPDGTYSSAARAMLKSP